MILAAILLVIAYAVAVIALVISEDHGAFKRLSRLRLNLLVATALAIISSMLFWWEFNHPPVGLEDRDPEITMEEQGARLSGAPGPLNGLSNGNYSLGFLIENKGKLPTYTHDGLIGPYFAESEMSVEQEDNMFKTVYDSYFQNFSPMASLFGVGVHSGEIEPGIPLNIASLSGIDMWRWALVMRRAKTLYLTGMYFYTDKIGMRYEKYYYQEFCYFYSSVTSSFIRCKQHNARIILKLADHLGSYPHL